MSLSKNQKRCLIALGTVSALVVGGGSIAVAAYSGVKLGQG